jgi:hypothetical protein
MANQNSTQITAVYGTSTDAITASSPKDGADKVFDATSNSGAVKTAKFDFNSASAAQDTFRLTVLPKGAVVLNATLQTSAALGGGSSTRVNFFIDDVQIGTHDSMGAINSGAVQVHSGWDQAPVAATGIGLVTLVVSDANTVSGSVDCTGQIFYYVDN